MPDLALLRDDLSAFAEAAGAPLMDWQTAALQLEARTTVVVAPRQSGKSRSLALAGLWWAFRRREQRVLIVSAGEDASRRLLSEVRRIAAGSAWLASSVVDESAGLLVLTNGSEIRSVPASERQIRGWSVDLLLVDEAALVDDALISDAAVPTTAAREHARVVLASSATTASGVFYDFAARGEQGSEFVRTYRWRLQDAWWISPTVIAAARESMSPQRFSAEFEGVFAGSSDALLTPEMVKAVTVDFHHYELGELQPPARFAAGMDWGMVNDRSVLTAVGRLDVPGPPVYAVACSKQWPAGFPNDHAIREIVSSPAHFQWLISEVNGLGGPLTQNLWAALRSRAPEAGGGVLQRYVLVEEMPDGSSRALGYRGRRANGFVTTKIGATMTAQMKAALFSGLRLLIERRQLLVPASAEHLVRELLMLRVSFNEGGTEKIEAAAGHDDAAVSLALALRPIKRESGVSVRLLELARAGGVREELPAIPRYPGWRSVVGDEVSPRAVEPPDPRTEFPLYMQKLAELEAERARASERSRT